MQDLYEILQVDPTASQEQIKQSFKRLVLLHHPDKGQATDTSMFVKLSNAWEILGDEALRKEYDAKWREWHNAQHLPIQEEVVFSSFDESDSDYTYPCRCGDVFTLSRTDAKWMFDIVCCETCSLTIKVLYEDEQLSFMTG